jgi:hypothetical protein
MLDLLQEWPWQEPRSPLSMSGRQMPISRLAVNVFLKNDMVAATIWY